MRQPKVGDVRHVCGAEHELHPQVAQPICRCVTMPVKDQFRTGNILKADKQPSSYLKPASQAVCSAAVGVRAPPDNPRRALGPRVTPLYALAHHPRLISS